MSHPAISNYFDYAATSPPWQEALDIYVKTCREFFENPSSIHKPGTVAKNHLLTLKKAVCDIMRFYDGRLLMCSSASEANSTIIEGHLRRIPHARLLIAEDVHDSIWYATKKHSKSMSILHIDKDGSIDSIDFEEALHSSITMACISHACHETGVIHPVKHLAEIAHRLKVRVLIDGVQAIGRLPIFLGEIPWTYYSFSGHKFGAPKGTGGVFIRDNDFDPVVYGGKQQWGMRAGTEDIAGIASVLAALQKSISVNENESVRLVALRQIIVEKLGQNPKVTINSPTDGLPGILSLSVKGISGRELVGALSIAGFAISTGAACQSNQMEPSRILLAMGKSRETATSGIRISMGYGSTTDAVENLVKAILELID